tara:strand:+ start:3295 stop:5073 length:1779 start_codon:yes stop_codon:yes gene_type:complete
MKITTILILLFSFIGYLYSIPILPISQESQTLSILPETEFHIALIQKNIDILKSTLLKLSDPSSESYGQYLSKEWIRELVSPTLSDSKRVIDWLKSYDMNVIVNYGDNIYCRGYISDVNRLFNVDLKVFNFNSRLIYRSNIDYTIPDNLKDIIVFVEGISNRFYERNYIKINKDRDLVKDLVENITVDNNYIGKESIYRLYNVSDVPNQTSISLGSIEYQGNSGFSADNLLSAEVMNCNPNNTVKNIVGTDTSFPDTESELDIQMMGITVPNVDLWFWDDNNWLYSLGVSMNAAKNIPDVISMSWGWSESDQCSVTTCNNETSRQYVDRVNNEYVKLGVRGLTITVSSGDAGAPGRTNEGCYDNSDTVHAAFPGSSPWITSVGATFIEMPDKNITYNWSTPLCKENQCITGTKQYVTHFNYTGWTAGGGICNYTDRNTNAKWQNDVVTKYLSSGVPLPLNFNKNGRAYPDVSVVGHYCPVVSGNFIQAVDGTSCSSPIFASLLAILNEYQVSNGKPKLGFVNPVLYRMYNDNPLIFNDIKEGNNWATEQGSCQGRKDGGSDFGYNAAEGYDPVYGLGTPNIGLMKEWLDSNT